MTNAIDVSCPQCQKKIKATEELRGKKVRCNGCKHVFAIPPAEAAKPGPASTKPPPVKVIAKPRDDEEGGGAYGVAKEGESLVPRCPHCAGEMESETARICLHCGYDTATRQRLGTKRTYDVTAGDRSAWLMPGFLAIGGIFALVILELFIFFAIPKLFDESSDLSFLDSRPVKLWSVILSVVAALLLGKFAYGRLIVNPTPPEKTRG